MYVKELERELERYSFWLSIALIPWICVPISVGTVLVCNWLL